MQNAVFLLTNICLLLMLISLVWSIVMPHRRIWVAPGKNSWQFWWIWTLVLVPWIGAHFLAYWSFSPFTSYVLLRLWIGISLLLLGIGFALWGIYSLGVINSTGIKDGFVMRGAYRYSRNPQYLGDIVAMVGIMLLVWSECMLVTGLLFILCLAIAPLAEESWLEEQYGEDYIKYCTQVARFI